MGQPLTICHIGDSSTYCRRLMSAVAQHEKRFPAEMPVQNSRQQTGDPMRMNVEKGGEDEGLAVAGQRSIETSGGGDGPTAMATEMQLEGIEAQGRASREKRVKTEPYRPVWGETKIAVDFRCFNAEFHAGSLPDFRIKKLGRSGENTKSV
eukprot:Gb_37018 [translate_table: standard]